MKRKLDLENKVNSSFDILIIGGGITGAGALMEASKRGYKTVLIEKGDFASGTSSRSAKLVHGGFRYLKYGHFGLVKEALKERDYLLKNYPNKILFFDFIFIIF